MAQANVTVQGGRFVSVQFSQKGSDLNPGNYTLDVTMPLAAVQPKSVQAVIGKSGQNLSGPLVKKSEFGIVLEYSTAMKVGAGPDADKDQAARQQEKRDRNEWIIRTCNENIEIANRLVRAGKVRGSEVTGSARQAKVDECISELRR